MNRQILRAIRQNRRMWQRVKDGPVTQEYRETERKVKNLIRNAKRNMERKLAYENGGNSKPFYSYLKSKTKNRTPVGPLKNNGATVTDKKEMATILNSYFSSVFSAAEQGEIPRAESKTNKIIEDLDISAEKIEKRIGKLKQASAAGPDGIGAMMLQQLKKQVAPALETIFRKSLDE
jgi:hypothetical protein